MSILHNTRHSAAASAHRAERAAAVPLQVRGFAVERMPLSRHLFALHGRRRRPNHKAGSHLNACVRDLGVAASLALQFGCSLGTLRRAVLRNADGSSATALGAALDIISGRAR
jgi:hypothetical protein